MCLTTAQTEAKVLDFDLIAYKIMRVKRKFFNLIVTGYCSPYNHFIWQKNKLYQQSLGAKRIPLYSCAFLDSTAHNFYEKNYPVHTEMTEVSEGFHAILTKKRTRGYLCENEIVVKVRIPKGSKVFFDETDLIVADQMILIG